MKLNVSAQGALLECVKVWPACMIALLGLQLGVAAAGAACLAGWLSPESTLTDLRGGDLELPVTSGWRVGQQAWYHQMKLLVVLLPSLAAAL
jgi:hypothetical protein